MDKVAKAVEWLATGDVKKELSTRCIATKVVIFIIRVLAITFLLYVTEELASEQLFDALKRVYAVWIALVTSTG